MSLIAQCHLVLSFHTKNLTLVTIFKSFLMFGFLSISKYGNMGNVNLL